jgi:hypothetical protein
LDPGVYNRYFFILISAADFHHLSSAARADFADDFFADDFRMAPTHWTWNFVEKIAGSTSGN